MRLIGEHGRAHRGRGLYMYLAYHSVHGAVNEPNFTLQAPLATVHAHYNATAADTFKVAGAMVTALDDGVGRVVAALRDAKLYDTAVIAFHTDSASQTQTRDLARKT